PDRLERPRHHPLGLAPPHVPKRAVLRVPVRMVFVPISHDLVHAATVHTPGHAAHQLPKMTREHGTRWSQYHVVDIAVQGLLQSEYDLRHTTKPPSRVGQRSPQ